MMTLSGTYIGRDEGAPTIDDIARGLSRMPRFAGQTTFLWTVADHSIVCMRLAKKLIREGLMVGHSDRSYAPFPLHVLLHDGHEALTGDIPTTFKTDDMRKLQKRLDVRIYCGLGLPMPTSCERAAIKTIDRDMLLAEAFVCTPQATYSRIVVENRVSPSRAVIRIVEEYIAQDQDPQDGFLEAYTQYLTGTDMEERIYAC